MPRRPDIRKVLVIGSGPITIGQAAEFDYSGSQACRALSEEGVEVVLVNSNPATIMTDPEVADRIYIEPLTPEFVARVLEAERPQGLLPTLGGQTGLNLAAALDRMGVLAALGVEVLGTPLSAIHKGEDRELFRAEMQRIGQPVPESIVASTPEEAVDFSLSLGDAEVVIRPAFTLGGTGGGLARGREAVWEAAERGIRTSPIGQVLVERSVAGWKEIEYEILRDADDNCIAVCNMENVDPMGVHTGDSIVVAPSLTLSDREHQMLRRAAFEIVRALGVEGGCNVQFALDPNSERYYVIEVNPRLSRSSALASKATGYPIARVAAKIALGYRLWEIQNSITRGTACFEPALDYVVVKIPRWPFDKFGEADRRIGTQMKSTGEVMAIGRTFTEALLKAARSVESTNRGLWHPALARMDEEALWERVRTPCDERLWAVAELLRRGAGPEELAAASGIDPFFIWELERLVRMERRVERDRSTQTLWMAKRMGLGDAEIARLQHRPEEEVRAQREEAGIVPVYKLVDTCAGEFPAATPYYYSTYEEEDEAEEDPRPCAVVLGSGPIRIGQGIEFDYSTVHAVRSLREAGVRAVVVNNNPETVSTDFDTSDRLYFEPLTVEDVLHVVRKERPVGVLVQFGGQTALNLAVPLARAGVPILGTSVESLDISEDRRKFYLLLDQLGIPHPDGGMAHSVEEAKQLVRRLGLPVVVRPSYVLGGRGMRIVYEAEEVEELVAAALAVDPARPVLVDAYLRGQELEVDAIGDGVNLLLPGIMEHVEAAGVHSGDSISIFPAPNVLPEVAERVVEILQELNRALRVQGFLNVQFVVHDYRVYVLEANLRASRTVPFISKVLGAPLVQIATRVMLGSSLTDLGYPGVYRFPAPRRVGVKVPVFSSEKLMGAEVALGPEMRSTGEVMGIDRNLPAALYKGIVAAGWTVPPSGAALLSVARRARRGVVPIARRLQALGIPLLATPGTAATLQSAGVPCRPLLYPEALEAIRRGEVGVLINVPTAGHDPRRWGFRLRRAAVEHRIPCLTTLETAQLYGEVLAALREEVLLAPQPMTGPAPLA
ncbi:MAG: carbamoyl-phosphate synthase large subunit [Armatimonadota bacterium]|nr:carbamoyl-phosphate synthase large subunit [Armatimonadota bacterium]MDR7439764.1 carbamoyl-phosphate synthase large subunit [Armatimonadota bacterium]MDR7562275.1 carbamoyl-phosphate synthase large subunit [Armatimonadota bacterium]MDR7568397.1 carbamoyl-phosphate synthase large subunit [Armatimonadota bacterium]